MPEAIPQNARDYFKSIERRVMRLERRGTTQTVQSVLGPGLTALAVRIMDWNSRDTTLNGFYYSGTGSINSPDSELTWTGQVIAKDDGTGMQQVWNTDGPETLYWMRTYAPTPEVEDENVIFTEWKKFATASGFIGEGELDPAIVDQINEPPLPPSDGLVPTVKSVVTSIGGIGSMFYRWTEVPNEDPVTYRLHVRATPTVPGPPVAPTTDGTYEVASGVGITSAAIRKLADGTSVVANGSVTYSAIVTVEDADNATLVPPVAPLASDPVTGVPAQVTGPDIATNAVTTGMLVFNDGWGINLTGEKITGATIQTVDNATQGIHLDALGIRAYGPTGAPPFFDVNPLTGMVIVAGEGTFDKLTTTGKGVDPGESSAELAGVTEIKSGGTVRLTSGATPPAASPTVDSTYDIVQFTNDTLWANRYGWTTDGTYWYTVRVDGIQGVLEKWNDSGTLNTSTDLSDEPLGGVVYYSGYLYVLVRNQFSAGGVIWYIEKYDATTLAYVSYSNWNDDTVSGRLPALGVDSATGNLITAQPRLASPHVVRIRHYTFNAGGNLTSVGSVVDTNFGYDHDLAGIAYGAADLGATRYAITARTTEDLYWVTNSVGDAVAQENWESPAKRIGFSYVSRTASVTLNGTTTVTAAAGTFKSADAGTAITGTDIPANTVIASYVSSSQVTLSAAATSSGVRTATIGAFVTMDHTGDKRTFTAGDKGLGISSAGTTKWVSSTNYRSGVPWETPQSPRKKIVLRKRSKLSVQTAALPPSPGVNDPNQVQVYVGTGATDPGVGSMARQATPAVGVVNATYAWLNATVVANQPRTSNNFPAAGLSKVELADGTTFINSAGDGSVGTGTFRTSVQTASLDAIRPIMRRHRATAQLIADSTYVRILFTTLDRNSSLLATNTGTTTVQRAGEYDCHVQIPWAGNATGRRIITFRVNGVEVCRTTALGSSINATDGAMDLLKQLNLAVNDTFEVWVYQNSTVSLNVLGDTVGDAAAVSIQTFLDMKYVGA